MRIASYSGTPGAIAFDCHGNRHWMQGVIARYIDLRDEAFKITSQETAGISSFVTPAYQVIPRVAEPYYQIHIELRAIQIE